MSQISYGDAHGLYRVQIGLVGDDGYNYGTAGEEMANGTTSSAYVIRFATAAEMAMPDRTVIDFTGGDVWTGSYVHGITSLGTFSLTLSTVDATLISIVTQIQVDKTTNSRWSLFGDNILLPTPKQVWMTTTFRIQSKEPGTKGASKFIHQIVPRCWLSPRVSAVRLTSRRLVTMVSRLFRRLVKSCHMVFNSPKLKTSLKMKPQWFI